MKKHMKPGMIGLYAILILAAVITVYPFLWMVSASFKPLKEIVGGNLALISDEMSFDNYKYIFGRSSLFPRWFVNSLIISVIGTAVNVFINTMAGYSLSRLSFPGRDTIYHLFLALMMVPAQVLLIPNYLILQKMGLLDSYSSGGGQYRQHFSDEAVFHELPEGGGRGGQHRRAGALCQILPDLHAFSQADDRYPGDLRVHGLLE